MSAINTLGVTRSANNLLTLFDANDGDVTESVAYERRAYLHHVVQLTCDDAGGEVDIEVSLDGAVWSVVDTLTGLSVINQHPNSIWPCLRARRKDGTEAPLTLKVYSAES